MDYIVSPAWVYLSSITGGLLVVFVAITIACLCMAIWNAAVASEYMERYPNKEKRFRGRARNFLIAALICGVVGALLPTQKTMIYMKIAEHATYSNAEVVVGHVKEAVDYIVNAIEQLG